MKFFDILRANNASKLNGTVKPLGIVLRTGRVVSVGWCQACVIAFLAYMVLQTGRFGSAEFRC